MERFEAIRTEARLIFAPKNRSKTAKTRKPLGPKGLQAHHFREVSPVAAGNRKSELSWLSLAFCLMVLFSHCSGHPITHLRTDSWQFALVLLLQRLTYVSVYGFFALSGIKLTLPRSKPVHWPTYWKGRAKSLLIPYLVANVVYYVFYCWGIHWYNPSWEKFLGYLLHGNLVSPFYFLIVMFQFTLLAPAIKWIAEHLSPALALPVALVISWGSEVYLADLIGLLIPDYHYRWADRTFTTYLVYYLGGCYIGRYYDRFTAGVKKFRVPIFLLFAALAGADLYLLWRLRVKGVWSQLVVYSHLAYLLAAILFCFYAALWLDRPLPKVLARVEQASFLVYLYHSILISALDWLSMRFAITDVGLLYAIRLPLVFVGTPVLCIVWQEIHKRLSAREQTAKVKA